MRTGLGGLFLLLAWLLGCEKAATGHAVSGKVSGADAGVVLTLSAGGTTVTQAADPSGAFAFSGVADGIYTLTPGLSDFAFTPTSRSVVVSGADVHGQDFASAFLFPRTIFGSVAGVAVGGVRIDLGGGATRSTATDARGAFQFDRLADGTYTLTPSAPDASFLPPSAEVMTGGYDVGIDFRSTPPSSPFSVTVIGDALSGVDGGTFPGHNASLPNPDVIVYYPDNDVWIMTVRFNSPVLTGLGGVVAFRGTPTEGTYTETTSGFFQGFGDCWAAQSTPGPNLDQYWMGRTFTLELISVGAGRQTNVPGTSLTPVVDYPVHGTLHVPCTPDSTSAQGIVTLETQF